MQTFLPFEDFEGTAKILDRRRLGKQRVECKQIFRAIHLGGAWKNHPAVKMWRGHAAYLYSYYCYIVDEWVRRGYVHNMTLDPFVAYMVKAEPDRPYWLGCYEFHYSHRSMLVYKDPKYYKPRFDLIRQAQCLYQETSRPHYCWPPPLEESLVSKNSIISF